MWWEVYGNTLPIFLKKNKKNMEFGEILTGAHTVTSSPYLIHMHAHTHMHSLSCLKAWFHDDIYCIGSGAEGVCVYVSGIVWITCGNIGI